jgi:beta-xylosidase
MSVTATNPVLPGCFPDPSVVRVGRDYPVSGAGHADLGRETFLAQVRREQGWPVFNPGEGRLTERVEVALPAHPWPQAGPVDHFDAEVLDTGVWNTLRGPYATGPEGGSGVADFDRFRYAPAAD